MIERMNFAERLERMSVELGTAACWPWPGHLDKKGYSRVWYAGRSELGHRAAYMQRVGRIDSDLTIDHLCKNRACLNPAHMEVVSQAVNTLRGDGTATRNKAKTRCVNGHEFTPENTRLYTDRRGRVTRFCRACCARRCREYAERRTEREGSSLWKHAPKKAA